MSEKGIKYCVQCGEELPENVMFCAVCGAKQTVVGDEKSGEQVQFQEESSPNMTSAFKLGIREAFTLGKCTNRANFWWLYLDLFLINVLLGMTLVPKAMSMFSYGMGLYSFQQLILQIIVGGLWAFLAILQFSASVRRLHDTNRSGNCLWLGLIPVVGLIMLIVFFTKESDSKGKRFDKHYSSEKWYKKWQNWVILVILTLICTISINSMAYATKMADYNKSESTISSKVESSSSSSESEDTTDESSSSDAKDGHTMTLGRSKIDIADQKDYATKFKDTTWAGTNFSIDKVTVYKTDGTYDGNDSKKTKFNGIVKVHMAIKVGSKDISTFPAQATLNTNDGQQVEADMYHSDDFDGDLNANAQKDGNIYFLIPKLEKVSDLTTARLKWTGSYDTDDYEDDNSHKDFDAQIALS
ncbi:DUF805 domain-containing protein [Levilactobacillus acidifarinae]|uniref:Zinc-ribbon domain-containing protein n=1 Tax=Levilactobacillus acidifarinae DSM 19394 = JCM 15949 TaxID=1423715 RepID=A0A0R1LP27_9LACO|nr:DUF805 domain-containing protein [Levilactobacillus acidifarinae]KRK93946.1 hypothetical protein FD25_GL001274 [Levilactobacillus acidifarinae DSM 19394]GEO68834.1 membrane protein [Levilactobacillus acidifarinae]